MTKREVMQMALDALYSDIGATEAIEALRAELAKPEPKPKVIGWFDPIYKDYSRVERIGWTPLYRKEDM